MQPAASKSAAVMGNSDLRVSIAAIASLAVTGPFLFLIYSLSLHYDDDAAWEILWWLSWSGVLCVGLACLSKAATAFQGSAVKLVVAFVYVGLMFSLLLAGMWFLARYSFAYTSEKGALEMREVNLDQLADVAAKDNVALIALQQGQGYAQPDASFKITNFSYGCHGELIQGSCPQYDGSQAGATTQSCMHLHFPDVCPGAELLIVSPVWYDNSSQSGVPNALAFQSKIFLFEDEAGRNSWAAQTASPQFGTALCRGGSFCAFSPANAHVQAHWQQWHSSAVAEVVQESVGTHGYNGLPFAESFARAKALAAHQMTQLNCQDVQVPLLWVPADTRESFQAWEQRLEQSEKKGATGHILLLTFACLFALTILCYVVGSFLRRGSTDVAAASAVSNGV